MWPFKRKSDELNVLSLLPPGEAMAGGLPNHAVLGVVRLGKSGAINDFKANPSFADFMHSLLKRLLPSDEELLLAAKDQVDGWIYIFDANHRTKPDGSIPAEDIVCGVRVENGVLDMEQYFANPKYEVFSLQRGTMRLPELLHRRFVEELVASVKKV